MTVAPTTATTVGTAPQRLRVLVNAIHARAGGGLTYLRHLLPLLAAEPDLALAIIAQPAQARMFEALLPQVRIHCPTMPKSWFGLLLWEQLSLPFLAWRLGFDVLLSPANFGPLALRRQVIVVQNAPAVGRLEKRLARKLYWITLQIMTALSLLAVRRAIAVSHYVAASAAPRWLPHRALAVIHHGVLQHGVAGARSGQAQARQEAPFLLAVGDIYVQKNFDRLIEAFAIVRRGRPAIELRVAGAAIDGELAESLKRQAAALGLAAAVRFLGRCEAGELDALYGSCAVFVFPSIEESFGMPLVEAMACGAPVVAAHSAATPEIAGDAALLCEATDAADMARAIGRVLDDPDLAATLRRRARERAAAFSWPACGQATAAVLREAARGG